MSRPLASLAPRPTAASLKRYFGRIDRTTPVWLLVVVLLILLIALPLGWMVVTSVTGRQGFTLNHYVQVFTQQRYLNAIWATFRMATRVGLLAVGVGSLMGWLVARTDLPAKRFWRSMVLASFVTPPFLGAFAWTLLAGPNAGVINQWWRALTGSSEPLVNIYSMGGLSFVVFLYIYPYVFTMITNSLDMISSDLEEAANILGASSLRVAATVTLPLVLPAILSGFILAFVQSFALFGSPAILAMPAGFHTVVTQIWQLFQFPPRIELAAALATPMLVMTALLLWLQRRILGRRGYATVLGKSTARKLIPLGKWKWPALAFCTAVVLLAVGMPYYILVRAALSHAWAQPFTLENFTWNNIRFVLLDYTATRTAMQNTFVLGIVTATAAALLAALVAYIVHRRLVRGTQLVEVLSTAPVAVPGIVLAVGLFITYTRPPLVLYGTLWILFLAYLTKELPIAYAQSMTTFRSIHGELEEASRIAGASRLRTLLDVTVPLAKTGVIAAWCFVFIGAIRELSASILLFTARTRVVSVVIYDLKEEGMWGAISVLGVLLLAVTFLVVFFMQRYFGRDPLRG
ncbi:MAG TPA: iron ABC transporter permease [Limnochordales bacterium]